MEREKPQIEKLKEKERERVVRYELDPEKGIDVVIEAAPDKDWEYKSARIVLQQRGNEAFDFKEILPRDYKFTFPGIEAKKQKIEKELGGDTFYHDPIEKFIIIPRKWREKAKDILGLLHEISHSLDKDLLKTLGQVSEWSDILAKIEKTESETGEISEMDLKMTQEEQRKYLELYSRMERHAWATAFNIIRKIKREKGIDLLKPFRGATPAETRRSLENYINSLSSLGYAEKWDVIGSSFAEELKGIFTTKIYKGEKFTPEHRKRIRK